MEGKTKKQGLLANAFQSKFWDSKITSANVQKREIWLGYVAGPFGVMLLQSIVNSYFNQYLTDIMGFTVSRGAWIAIFMIWFPLLSKALDAVTNLIMAKALDLTTCRQGKLRPWFILSLPIIVVSMLMLFRIPNADSKVQAIWVVVAYNLFYSIGYTMWYMAYEMSAALSTRNVKQRSGNSMAGQITKNMGTGIISITFPLILKRICALLSGDMREGYLVTMTILCCVAVPLTFIQYFFTKERVTEERRALAASEKIENKKEANFLTQLKACVTDKYWVMLILMILIYQVFNALKSVSQVYYAGWVVHGNSYGDFASIQAKFTMIAMAPMGPALFIIVPLIRKVGRHKMIIIGSIMTILGAGTAFFCHNMSSIIYVGTAFSGIGGMCYVYTMMTFIGDAIDHVEYAKGIRADGLTAALVGFFHSMSNGLGQGLFNLGLMLFGYKTPEQIGTDAKGVALYADQSAGATGWINFSYQGAIALTGVMFFVLFVFFFDIEKQMSVVSVALQEKKKAECAALGIEYVTPQEQQRREIEKQKLEAEENRIRELKERCSKKGLDFEKENQKYLDKAAKKAARKAARKKNK